MRTTYQDNSVFKLIVRLTDAEGNLFDPDVGPTVSIFAPGDDLDDDSSADVLSASVASLGAIGQQGVNLVIRESLGIYSYIFPIDGDATEGGWTDRWTFTNDSIVTTVDFTFSVIARVQLESTALSVNQCVLITLDSSILDTNGTELGTDVVIRFWTPLTPMYSSVNLVMGEAGGYLRGVDESAIVLALYEASLEADIITFQSIRNSRWYNFARRKWVTCMAARQVMVNLVNNLVKKKQLADLTVEYDLSWYSKIDELKDCVNDLTPVLESGGELSVGASYPVQTTTKGVNDADYPDIGRGFESSGERGGGNANVYTGSKTRVTKTYRSKRGGGSGGTSRKGPLSNKWGSGSGF